MPKYDKNKTKALFKQLFMFKKTVDREKAKTDDYYRKQITNIIRSLKNLIKDSIRVDPFLNCKRWGSSGERTFALGTIRFYDFYEANQYWPDSVKKAIKENDASLLKRKAAYFYKNGKYYSKSEYFSDPEGNLYEREKYYEGIGGVAYSKEKYIFATTHGTLFVKKQTNKPKYEKKIPTVSSVTLAINRWSRCTKEFVWSMFEYDGKALPDLNRDQYGFSFKNIKKLKFKPTKEHIKILQNLGGNEKSVPAKDDTSIIINIYRKEKSHKKAVQFLKRLIWNWKKIELLTIQEKLDALGKIADLEEKEDELLNN